MKFRAILMMLSAIIVLTPVLAENAKNNEIKSKVNDKIQSMTKEDFIESYKKVHSRVPQTMTNPDYRINNNSQKAKISKPQKIQVNSIQSLPENIWIPGEYEEVKAILITWPYFSVDTVLFKPAEQIFDGIGWCSDENNDWYIGPVYSYVDTFSLSPYPYVFANLAHAIDSDAEVWINIWNAQDSNTVKHYMDSLGMPLKNYKFFVNPGNSFWYRDCGPVGYYYGDKDSVGFIDFEYYGGRPLDDEIPISVAAKEGYPIFTTGIEYEGGNILLDGYGKLFTTYSVYYSNMDSLGQYYIDNEGYIDMRIKKQLSPKQIEDSLMDILNLNVLKVLPNLIYDGGTGHIDLYADMYDENTFVFSKYPEELKNFKDYTITKRNIDTIMTVVSANKGKYSKRYIPFPRKDNGNWYNNEQEYNNYTRTYTNHTFVNKTIIQPVFSDGKDGDVANMLKDLEEIKKQYPGYTIYPIDVRSFDGSGGAIHCITKQIPAENPLRIMHKPIDSDVGYYSSFPLTAKITNHSGIANAKVMWRYSDSKDFQSIVMTKGSNDEFNAAIPNEREEGAIDYYIEATSNNGKTIAKPITAPEGYYTFDISYNASGAEDYKNDRQFAGEFHPNPADGSSKITINTESGSIELTIYSIAGEIVYSNAVQAGPGESIISINTASFATGAYIVLIRTGDGKTTHRMLNVVK